MRKCPKCGEPLFFDQEYGEYVCLKGHVVLDHLVDERREWRAYDKEEVYKRSRVGAPTKYSDSNPYSTVIGWEPKSGDPKGLEVARRIKKLHARISSSDPKARRKTVVVEIIKEIAAQLNLPEVVIEEASRMYLVMDRKSSLRNRRVAPLALALLYYASRLHGLARSVDEFLEAGGLWFGSDKNKLKRSVRRYYMILKDNNDESGKPNMDSTQVILRYISRYSNTLGVSARSEILAKDIAKQIEKSLILGKDPKGLAAATLNLACNILNEDVRQSELSRVSGVSTVTIRKRKKEILENHVIQVYVKPESSDVGMGKELIGSVIRST